MAKKTVEGSGLINCKGKNVDLITGGGGYGGWNELWGQEIIEREIIPRVKPDDTVVDLGGAQGRASMPFAMRGIRVTIVDLNGKAIKEGDEIRRRAGARHARAVIADARQIGRKDIAGGATVIVASDLLNHMAKAEADEMIDHLPTLLSIQHRGLIYINAPSTESPIFQNPDWYGAALVNARTLVVECDCSGQLREENIPFFAPGEIESRLALQGGRILRSGQLERNGSGILNEVVALFN